MADAPAAAAGSRFGFLGKKVGPVPLWMWMAGGIGAWYLITRGKTSAASGSAVPNQQTDPAGNIGSIDPATGYVYGTPEDDAALSANNAGSGTTSATGGSTTAGQYADNNAWGEAAINYLVGRGIDPTTANQAIQLYLGSQALTTQQQADVNLAIQGIGSPPSLPGPSPANNPPVVTPPGGGTTTPPPGGGGGSWSYPAPTGLASSSVSDSGYRLSWNPVKGPAGQTPASYSVATYTAAGKRVDLQGNVGGTSTSEYGSGGSGLTPGTQYKSEVWANGGPKAPPHATVVVSVKAKGAK